MILLPESVIQCPDGTTAPSFPGDLYLLDFDTSCHAFPLYDVALVCSEQVAFFPFL